jgi:Zn-finger nucleic acid-binding protein
VRAESTSTNKLSLELKYCERCGGLWLRPGGGEQIYCVNCARAMAELPPSSYEVRRARVPRGPQRTHKPSAIQNYEAARENGNAADGGAA